MEWEGHKGNESSDPFGLRSAMQRKMAERGDDPASRARAEAEGSGEVSDAEIAELLDAGSPDTPPPDADEPGG